MAFKAPVKPGWYFLTHATHEGNKCKPEPSMHATGPENAVAAILVEAPADAPR
jgi:hypothetical protein